MEVSEFGRILGGGGGGQFNDVLLYLLADIACSLVLFFCDVLYNTRSPMGNDRSQGASIMFGDILIYEAQRQVTLFV